MSGLPRTADPNLLVGFDESDDAAVYRVSDDVAMVQTVDFFPPVVDDPYTFGQIAAANALSDVYAMGGVPKLAMNLLAFPSCLPLEAVGEILAGGASKVAEAGAVIAGGHSIEDPEPKYGLCVTGLVHPHRVLTNSGGKEGDILVLTKPLGTGILTTAAKAELLEVGDYREVGAVLFSDVLLAVIDGLLLPMVYLYIGVAAAGAVLEENALETIGELLKKVVVWVLSGLLVLFTTFLTVSGAIAGHADAQAVRLAKSAVSAAVPVVGGILSDAAESVMAGAGILKGMIGAFGALAVLSACLVPFLRLGCQYLLYQGAGLVAGAAGPKNLTALLRKLGDAFGLVLAMTGTSALLLIITLVSSLTAVTP